MTHTCINCGEEFTGKFCNNCGQPTTHRINTHFLLHDIQHGLLHLDKGVLYTAKELFTRPGHSIREFIEGKRVKHFKPISLVLVLAGIYGFIYHYYGIDMIGTRVAGQSSDPDSVNSIAFLSSLKRVNDWIGQHYALLTLLMLPVSALATFIAFRKSGYNFIEHCVLNAFITSQKLMLRILLLPLFYYLNGSPALYKLDGIVYFVSQVLMFWTLIQFFNGHKKMKAFFMALLSYIIFWIIYLGFAMLFAAITSRIYSLS